MSGRETEFSENEHRRSDDPSFHYMGCSCPLLYDQHWQTSEVFDFSRSADGMAVSTFKTVGEVDIDFRANKEPATRGTNMADGNECGVEIKAPENHKDFVRCVSNRKQECQKTVNKDTTGNRFGELPSLSSGREREFESDTEDQDLAIRQLCRNEHIVPSRITETRSTNQNSCNIDSNTENERALPEMQNDYGSQHAQDLPLLLKLLKSECQYRDETNKSVLNDVEIRLFAGMYGITDFRLVLACGDSVFWLEGPDGVIYFWSRIDDSMIRGGDNMKEAITNYLFHEENLYYVDEVTRKLVPIDAYDKEAEEWAKSPEACINIDVIKVSLKHESKTGGKKKQHKKKKNKKKKNKH